MATVVEASVKAAPSSSAGTRLNPTAVFWVAGLIVYGAAAAHAASGHFLNQTSRDLWQHLAALRALIANPFHSLNPFIPTDDPSRHFNPYWVGMALLARGLGWNEWQAIGCAAFVSAGVLLTGIYNFGRAFYRDPAGPLALLASMVLFWIVPNGHTGYHSITTLIEGFAYPATLLIGLSLHLWGVVIRALERWRWALLIAPISAVMLATHQLGAVIGFIASASLILLSPARRPSYRAGAAIAMGIGILASTAWPYMNPVTAMLRPGNSTWTGGVDFYSRLYLFGAFIPQIGGLLAFLHPKFRQHMLPISAAFCAYMAIFALGLAGVLIATRFLMPAVLMLHIGIGALLIDVGRRWPQLSKRRQLALFAGLMLLTDAYVVCCWAHLSDEVRNSRRDGNAFDMAVALTAAVPDMEPVAAYDVAAWPVIATGQRALSEPWPEPGIPDLAIRQRATERLFDPDLTKEERLALARRWGVRILILDATGPMRRPMPPHLIETLDQQSIRHERSGSFLRFDLY